MIYNNLPLEIQSKIDGYIKQNIKNYVQNNLLFEVVNFHKKKIKKLIYNYYNNHFTFAYKKQRYGNKWEIINHHSSIIPRQPGILQGVFNRPRFQKFKALDSYQLHLRQRPNYCYQVKEYKKK